MESSLQKKITLASLIKYTLPSVIMMIFFSFYTIVDGMFVSRFIGSNALSAVNIVFPVIYLVLGIGIMFATGGSAIVAKKMGEGKTKEARENFTLISISALVVGIIIEIITIVFMKEIIYTLGSTKDLYYNCREYLFYMIIFTPFIILKCYFDYFLVTAGEANLGLISGVIGGIVNIILDYVFIVNFNLGIKGAALATCIGYMVPSIIGIVYFLNKSNNLHFVKPKFKLNVITKSCSNGSSEMITQLSNAVTTFLYNLVLIKLLGEDGVAAITIILYVQLLLNSAYMGFVLGVQPRISYFYGSKDKEQIKNIIKYSIIIISLFAVFSFILSRQVSELLIMIFTPKGTSLFNIAHNAFMIFSISFLFNGINIFSSGMFTAFSNGKVSAIISLLRTFVLFVVGMMILPKLLGVNGVWLVVPFAETLTLIVSILYMYKYQKEYMYSNMFRKRKTEELDKLISVE